MEPYKVLNFLFVFICLMNDLKNGRWSYLFFRLHFRHPTNWLDIPSLQRLWRKPPSCVTDFSRCSVLSGITSASLCSHLRRRADLVLRQPVADSPLASLQPISTLRTLPPSDGCHTTTTETSWSKCTGSALVRLWFSRVDLRKCRFWLMDSQHVFYLLVKCWSTVDSLHTYLSPSEREDVTWRKMERLTSVVLSCFF